MKKYKLRPQNVKIVVVPHYSGSVKTTEVFRKVIAEQMEKKLNKSEKKNIDTTSDNNLP